MQTDELLQMFFSEAQDLKEQLDNHFTQLEKNLYNPSAIEAVFRIMHTLKANAAALGFGSIAEISHLLEDIFSLVRENPQALQKDVFTDLFRAVDKLSELIEAAKNKQEVNYKGILTRLKVIYRNFVEAIEKAAKAEKVTKHIVPTAEDSIIVEDLIPHPDRQAIAEDDFVLVEEAMTVKTAPITFSDTVSVSVKKLDNLLNLVEELSIEKDRIQGLNTIHSAFSRNEFVRLQRISSELQYSVMDARMVQINVLFQKLPRIVRDIAVAEKKEINLVMEGEQVEIDRNILQIISDSLIHLIRNAVSHGIESPEERTQQQKPPSGEIRLKAYNAKEWVVLEIRDNGRGIQTEKIKKVILQKGLISPERVAALSPSEIQSFIFESGFSSSDKVTNISGRGVGMDVVKKAVESVGGRIDTHSVEGEGTTFTLRLPTSMAVKPVLLFQTDEEEYGIPLNYTESVKTFTRRQLYQAGDSFVVPHGDKSLPLIVLKDFFNLKSDQLRRDALQATIRTGLPDEKLFVIIISDGQHKLGVVVDKLLHQREIIEKKLRKPLDKLRFISGACILGTGNVCLVLDILELLHFFFKPQALARA